MLYYVKEQAPPRQRVQTAVYDVDVQFERNIYHTVSRGRVGEIRRRWSKPPRARVPQPPARFPTSVHIVRRRELLKLEKAGMSVFGGLGGLVTLGGGTSSADAEMPAEVKRRAMIASPEVLSAGKPLLVQQADHHVVLPALKMRLLLFEVCKALFYACETW